MGPSQPSLQTQVKESPLTTQVPPLWQGFGRQLLFLAVTETRFAAESFKSRQNWAKGKNRGHRFSAASASRWLCRVFYLYYKWLLPILRDTCTWKCPPRRNTSLHCCTWPHRTGCHLRRTQTILDTSASLKQCNKFKRPKRARLLRFGNAELTGVARFSFPPVFTFTEEVVDQVSASSSIVARVFTAVVNI